MSSRSEQREIALLRATAQGLWGPDAATNASASDVVQQLLAVQAQDLAAAKWAVGRRLVGATLGDIDAALNDRSIVRSWPMRGTLHFVKGEDLGWMLSLTTPRLLSQARTRQAQLGLDSAIFERARALAVDALSGGRSLTREAFQELLETHAISTSDGRGYQIIWQLAQTATLCWGPTAGSAQSLVLESEWVRHPRQLSKDEALGEFVLRYVRGHGPATLQDFVWWSKLTVAEAKRGLTVALPHLVERKMGDETYWVAAELEGVTPDAAERRRFAASVALLPAFDEYFLGYRNRELAADPAHHPRIVPGKNGVFQPIVVAGGRVVATWKRRTIGKLGVAVSLEPFDQLSAAHRDRFEAEAQRYARFLGLTLLDAA